MITTDELLAQMKVCPTCRACVFEKAWAEHKKWHLELIEMLRDDSVVVVQPRRRWFPFEFGPRA